MEEEQVFMYGDYDEPDTAAETRHDWRDEYFRFAVLQLVVGKQVKTDYTQAIKDTNHLLENLF